MYELRTHILIIGLMSGMMADYYGLKTIGAISILLTWFSLEIYNAIKSS
jgi:hypothetical protein